jgi:hypothetical protein
MAFLLPHIKSEQYISNFLHQSQIVEKLKITGSNGVVYAQIELQ